MTPPDSNLKKETRRHLVPLIGMALAVLIGVGVVLYWIGEEVATAPGTPNGASEEPTMEEINKGDVDVSPSIDDTTPAPDSDGSGE